MLQTTGETRAGSAATDLTFVAGEAQATPQSLGPGFSGASQASPLPQSSKRRPGSPSGITHSRKSRATAHGGGGDDLQDPAVRAGAAGAAGGDGEQGQHAYGDDRGDVFAEGMSVGHGATPSSRKRKKAAVGDLGKEGGKAGAGKAKRSRNGADGQSPAAKALDRPSAAMQGRAVQSDAGCAVVQPRRSAAGATGQALTPSDPAAGSDQRMAHAAARRASASPGWVCRRRHDTPEEGAQDR